MDFLHRLWHRLLFGSSPRPQPPRPAARSAAARLDAAAAAAVAATIREWVKPHPPRYVYRSREEVELALLMPWLTNAERRRFLDLLLPRAGNHDPWTIADVEGEPWEQCQQWDEPLVITEPETMTSEGFCCLLEFALKTGLTTFCTPLEVLSRPVHMLWLYRQGQRAGQVYAALEQALGNRAQALNYAWWVIAGL